MANSQGSNTGIRAIPYLAHPAYDAFGRARVGEPQTLFDSKQIHDKAPLFWDEATVSGAGMSSAHLANEAATEITSTDNTAGHFVRQTFQRFNYQPGKSQRIFMTGVLNSGGGGTGVTSRIGYFDDNNGLFFQLSDGVFSVGIRSNATGSPVDTIINSSDFNGDQIPDSMGASLNELNIDWTKTQIFAINFEWLGVGSCIFSIFQDATEYVLHINHHANVLDEVYMSTPNLPVRYELITTADSVASKMKHICSSVISEGGQDALGRLTYVSNDGVALGADTAGTEYALLGVRLKSTHLDSVIQKVKNSILVASNANAEWKLLLNPTVASTFTYADVANSSLQVAIGVTANTVTGGTILDGGYVTGNSLAGGDLPNAIRLGSAIDGTPDELVLTITPLTNNQSGYGSLTLREFS